MTDHTPISRLVDQLSAASNLLGDALDGSDDLFATGFHAGIMSALRIADEAKHSEKPRLVPGVIDADTLTANRFTAINPDPH